MTKTNPTILIAMPLYQGWEHVGQALDSIRRQTYGNFRVLISVDGNDKRSYEACTPFMDDQRFELVLQHVHLDWHGNMTWLGEQLREDFFCYWQHDDHCEPEYLETLVKHAVNNPQATSIYCDMQVYGDMEKLTQVPSQKGFALERVMFHVLTPPEPAAIRCLVRAVAMKAALPITVVHTWLMTIARLGELHRVPQLMYHRRCRPESLTFTLPERSESVLKRDALEWALGVVKNLQPLIGAGEITTLFSMVVELTINQIPRGKYQYDFRYVDRGEQLRFVAEFLSEAESRLGLRPYPDAGFVGGGGDNGVHPGNRGRELLPGEDLLIDALRMNADSGAP
ncbi:glycosyltransferase family 2 protein [Hoeflea sp.]|uniref:glycosyltransferase family 2 protein n=1 Tax=Hoeflea sp. TaxID=1940281 RepID=UPI003B02779A